jgi:hypothetical protein
MLEDETARSPIPSSADEARPSIRLPRLPALAWLIVGLAALDAIWWIQVIAGALGTIGGPLGDWSVVLSALGAAIQGAADVLPVLLPAALLTRIPSAARSQQLLLGGLLVGAANEVLLRLALPLIPAPSTIDAIVAQQTAIASLQGASMILGPLLVGLGLARMRGAGSRIRPAEIALLALLAVALGSEIASAVVPMAARGELSGPMSTPTLVSTVLSLGATPFIAYQLWVPLMAWRDRCAPATFWRLLGLASIATVLAIGVAVVANLSMANAIDWPGVLGSRVGGGPFEPILSAASKALLALTALLALVAYGRHAPASGHALPPGGH